MDEKYDCIVLGTGIEECILSGLMSSVAKKTVLHLDKNNYYGGQSASLNLDQLYKKFKVATPEKDLAARDDKLGQSRNYSVDLCPKFLMACGALVKILLKTKVTKYLEFGKVEGSFVYALDKKKKTGSIHKVPCTTKEAMSTKLISKMEKAHFTNFIRKVAQFDPAATHKPSHPMIKCETAAELFKHFSLTDKCRVFVGHAIMLEVNDEYLKKSSERVVERLQLYANSVVRYGDSPYIYPKWGLGGLPEGFSRRSAIHGGVYMLNSDEKKNFIQKIVYDDNGKVIGVQVNGETAECKFVIGSPSYWADLKEDPKVKLCGNVVRSISILDHPIEKAKGKNSCQINSCQIIIPGAECGRESDIYICSMGNDHSVCPKGKYVAVCSALIEDGDEDKEPKDQLQVAFDIIGKHLEQFVWVTPLYKPMNDSAKDKCYITSSNDASTHFETATSEVLKIYQEITGEVLDLTPESLPNEQGEDPEDEKKGDPNK